jgi:hypothetical protein
MNPKERLRHKLKILAGLRPQSPTDEELELIVGAIVELAGKRRPTDQDWKNAAGRYVPNAGRYKYGGEDMSDLNALLVQILNQDDSSPPRVNK